MHMFVLLLFRLAGAVHASIWEVNVCVYVCTGYMCLSVCLYVCL